MAQLRGDFTDVLLRKKIISSEQLAEAEATATAQGLKLQDALIKLNYATAQEVMEAIAEHHGLQFPRL